MKKEDYCDNTDCKCANKQELYRIEMLADFECDVVYWCADCIKRDKTLIDGIGLCICPKCGKPHWPSYKN